MKPQLLSLLVTFTLVSPLFADGPADNLADKVRRVPPPGIKVPDELREELGAVTRSLGDEIAKLRGELTTRPDLARLLPDVEIFHKAVDWALRYDEFFKTNEFKSARALVDEGRLRAAALRKGEAPWLYATGAVARGYVSRIDGSVQPFGLVIPAAVPATGRTPMRLDIWFHGRGETLSELDFIAQRNNPKNLGEFAPASAIVLHPYARYCNGSRFAGETDAFEAMEALQREYPVDTNRIVVRGFSLGGASVWHFASHHAARWAAVAPGAGFSETADFLKVFQNEKLAPPWWEQKLWRLHDAPDWVENFRHLPTVAYSGETDRQKQAADVMATAFDSAGMKLTHVIGPQTAHKYHPDAKKQINKLIDGFAAKGRDPSPDKISFATFTTRYNRMAWGTVDALEQHWEPARITGETMRIPFPHLELRTTNITAFTLDRPLIGAAVVIDGQRVLLPGEFVSPEPARGLHLVKRKGKWSAASEKDFAKQMSTSKRHGLQGPIDDAFMDSFLVVRPTGKPLNAAVGAWTSSELAHMTNHWRQHYRGDARVKDDTAATREDIRGNNLILFGDPESNYLIKQLAGRLAIPWTREGIELPGEERPGFKYSPSILPSSNHVLVCIQPNPTAPNRYVVLNSGFTFREYDYLNNARQTPKLPDYAIIDVSKPITSRSPGAVATAGFFDESWHLPSPRARVAR